MSELYAKRDVMPIVGGHPKSATFVYEPATPEEIKDAHGKCGTCEHHWYGDNTSYRHLCSQDRLRGIDPTKSYCNHHEPKEDNNE